MRSALLLEQESASESCSGVTTPVSSSRRNLKDHSSSAESGYNTGSSGLLEGGAGGSVGVDNLGKSSVVSKESDSEAGGPNGTEKSQASQKTSTSAGTKRPKQLTRRNTFAVSNPSRSRAGQVQATRRSRLESADGSGSGDGAGAGTTTASRRSAGSSNSSSRGSRSTTESQEGTPRKKALSPPLSAQNRRLLPATPVRRSEKAHLAATRPKSMISTSPTNTAGGALSLAENNEGVPTTSPSKAKEDDSRVTEDTQLYDKSTETPTSANGTASQGTSRADGADSGKRSDALGNLQENSKIKHTVAYRDNSPLYRDGKSLIYTCTCMCR